MKRLKLRSFVLACALACASMPAWAAPTYNTIGGDTRVALAPEFTTALQTLGVGVEATFPARIRSTGAAFPIPTGEIDVGTLKGEIVHAGGLNLTAGALTVNLGSFVIDTTGSAPVLTGLVKANDSVVGRITLFDLALGPAPSVRGPILSIRDVRVTLSSEAAAALNDVFGVTAFAAGLPIGTARTVTGVYEPD